MVYFLKSYDGELFQVSKTVLQTCQIFSPLIQSLKDSQIQIPIANIKGNILKKILQYCTEVAALDDPADEQKLIDINIKSIFANREILAELIQAAEYLQIQLFCNCFKEGGIIYLKRSDNTYLLLKQNANILTLVKFFKSSLVNDSNEIEVTVNDVVFKFQVIDENQLRQVVQNCEIDDNFAQSSSQEDIEKQNEQKDLQNENVFQKQWFNIFKNCSAQEIHDLFLAGYFLNIEDFVNVAADYIAEKYVRYRPIEEIRAMFGIENDFTPEEEVEIQRQNEEWFNEGENNHKNSDEEEDTDENSDND